jgi:glutaredoxin 3
MSILTTLPYRRLLINNNNWNKSLCRSVIHNKRRFSSISQDNDLKDIQNIVNTNDIVIFSSPSCPYCAMAEKSLKEVKIDYKVIYATNKHMKVLENLTGMSSFPNIWVKGKFVGGCNDGPEAWMGIRPLIRNGELMKMLKKV